MRSSIEESKVPHPNSQITGKEETQANRKDPNTKPKGLPVFNGRKEINNGSSDNSRKGSSILRKVQTKRDSQSLQSHRILSTNSTWSL